LKQTDSPPNPEPDQGAETVETLSMDSTTAWASVSDLIEALSQGDAPTGFGTLRPTPGAVLGAKLALKLFRKGGTAIDPPPTILAMPWGSIVFWWRSSPQRRVEVVSRDEAYEFVETRGGFAVRRFMSGPSVESD
jgi:hypothetical protein